MGLDARPPPGTTVPPARDHRSLPAAANSNRLRRLSVNTDERSPDRSNNCGRIEMMNPVATALLLSMTSPETLCDIYSALASIAPDPRQRAAPFEGPAGVTSKPPTEPSKITALGSISPPRLARSRSKTTDHLTCIVHQACVDATVSSTQALNGSQTNAPLLRFISNDQCGGE